MWSIVRQTRWLLLASLVLALTTACGDDDEPTVITASQAAFIPIVESSDLAVGMPRLVLTLLDRDQQPQFGATATLAIRYFEPTEAGIKFRSESVLRAIEVGDRAYYVADEPPFDVAGDWAIAVTVVFADGRSESSPRLPIQVSDRLVGLSSGDAAPDTPSPSLADATIEQLTRDPEPLLSMYEQSVDQALADGSAFLLLFATHERCAGLATCRRAIEQAKSIARSGQLTVFHVEPFGRPQQPPLQAIIDAFVESWGVQAEPQFYLVDGDGVIRTRYEIVVEGDKLNAAISALLN